MNYGQKIINFILKKRAACHTIMNLNAKYRQIATEAILECLRLGYPLNDMEISGKAREMLRKRKAFG